MHFERCRNFIEASRREYRQARYVKISVGIDKFRTQRKTYERRVNHFAILVISEKKARGRKTNGLNS